MKGQTRLFSSAVVAGTIGMLCAVLAWAAPQNPPSAPVTVVNTSSNPVPVTGSLAITGTPTFSVSGEVQSVSADKTTFALQENVRVKTTIPANHRTSTIDVSGFRSVRVGVTLDFCSGCGAVTVVIGNPYPIDTVIIPATNGGDRGFSRVYEVPGEQLTISIGNNVPNEDSDWLVRVFGRAN